MTSPNLSDHRFSEVSEPFPESAVHLAQALVRIPSINPAYDENSLGEGAMVSWIRAWASHHQFEYRTFPVLDQRENIVLTLRNGRGPHGLLAGHTDTVSVDGMTMTPFSGEVLDGRLYGRGSADMKGPLASMLATLLHLRKHRGQWQGAVSVACVVDEEFQARGIKALMNNTPDLYQFSVVGEPTRLRVVRGCKGCLRFSFEAKGAAAHSSRPSLGRNAIVAMSTAILALETFFKSELSKATRAGFGSSTGSVGLVRGGTGINIVPDSCRASVDIRILPGQDPYEVFRMLRACVTTSVPDTAGITWVFDQDVFYDPAFETAEESELVKTSIGLLGQPSADLVDYSCDASKIAAGGVPCIIFGPGDIAEAHSVKESIPVAEIDAAVQWYSSLCLSLLPLESS